MSNVGMHCCDLPAIIAACSAFAFVCHDCPLAKLGMTRPPWTDPTKETERECKLRKEEVKCLKLSIPKDPKECGKLTQNAIDILEAYIKDKCDKKK